MRALVFKDKDIPQAEYNQLLKDYSAFIKKHTGIVCTFWTKEYDYSDYPTVLDTDGDDVMRPSFLADLAKETSKNYNEYGTDHLVTLIHESNWKSGSTANRKGIWGTNYSYRFGNYQVHYCRWDKKNIANTFGTLYHEMFHSFDALTQVETGINLNKVLGVTAFDNEIVHGKNTDYKYIRYQENTDVLKKIAPFLVSAYQVRLKKHAEYTKGLQLTVISLLERLVALYRQRLYKK